MDLQHLRLPLAIALLVTLGLSYGVGIWASRRVESSEDYIVAGRRLSLPLAWATLLATWFGAGTMLTAADEVRAVGLRAMALEPLGAGLCLVLAGAFFARRLWEMKLLTLGDFFARRFGPRAEVASALVMVPGYFGWIAVQFVALAGVLELFFGIEPAVGIALVAVVGTGYTLLGGMWAVTVTDALQLALLLGGLVVLGATVLLELGHGALVPGLVALADGLPDGFLEPIPTSSAVELLGWVGVLAVAALGNIPGQDLLQRIFSARSARVAVQACHLAGLGYLVFGAIPVLLGLASRVLLPAEVDTAIVPALAHTFLTPAAAVAFTVALTSAVLSTIDSAILSPASVLAQNVLSHATRGRIAPLTLDRIAVLLVASASLGVAYLGESAYALLESAYELGLAGLFVPLAVGLYRPPRRESPALGAIGIGLSLWLLHLALGWEAFFAPLLEPHGIALPSSLPTVAIVLGVYLVLDRGPAPATPR